MVATVVRAINSANNVVVRTFIPLPPSPSDSIPPKAKTPEPGRPGGTQAPLPRSLRLIRTIPSTPEFHRATAPERPILDCGSWMLDVSHFIRYPGSNIQDRFVQGPHGLSPPIGNSPFQLARHMVRSCTI